MKRTSPWIDGQTLPDGGTVFPGVPIDADVKSFEHREVNGTKQCRAVYEG